MNKGKVSIFKDRLAKMQGAANEAMAGYTPGGIKVPDSVYLARVQAEMTESQSSGNLMITRTCIIADGEFKGLKIWDHIVLEKKDENGNRFPSDRGLQNARRFTEAFGLPWPEGDLSELEGQINQINDAAPTCRIRSTTTKDDKTGDEYTRVRILGVEGAGEETQAQPEAQPVPEATAADELDAMNRGQLKGYIATNMPGEIRVTTKHSDADIRTMIRDYLVAQAHGYGERDAVSEATEATAPQVDVSTLLAFCASQQITEVEEGMEADQVIEIMKTYQYKKAELTDEEYQMLQNIGIPEQNIINPPAPPPKPAAPKPVTPPKPSVRPTTPSVAARQGLPSLPKLGAPKPGTLRPGLKK